jgi:putative MFS transporter
MAIDRAAAAAAGGLATPLSAYQRRLLGFLGLATFFEGYDLFALAQILPNLRADFGLTAAQGGMIVAVAGVGAVLAYLLVRRADEWGRRRVLVLSVVGYTVLSLLTALAPNAWVFGIAQLVGRIFLISEYTVAMIYAAEEYPADRRGMVIGVLQACSSFGAIVCAATVPLLLTTPLGWRSVYVVGALPLLLLAFVRNGLRETGRFAAQADAAPVAKPSFTRIFQTPYRRRVLQMGAIWALTAIGTQNAVTFWKEFAIGERDFSDAQVGVSLTVAAVVAMPLVLFSGKLLDVVGRRAGATVIFLTAAVGVFACYTLHDSKLLTAALILGVFGASAVMPVLNAYTTELFPTELRSEAFAWANNLIGRTGFLVSPLLVGLAADAFGWGPAVAATAVFPILALIAILWLLPETAGRELEETAALD